MDGDILQPCPAQEVQSWLSSWQGSHSAWLQWLQVVLCWAATHLGCLTHNHPWAKAVPPCASALRGQTREHRLTLLQYSPVYCHQLDFDCGASGITLGLWCEDLISAVLTQTWYFAAAHWTLLFTTKPRQVLDACTYRFRRWGPVPTETSES